MVANLFICHTPLHTLIAEKIIEQRRLVNPSFIFFYETKSPTIEFYRNRISKKYETISIEKSNNFVKDLFKILIKIQKLIRKKYICHIGNIKSFHSRFILSLVKIMELNTFDDGSGNISGEGYFYDLNERLHSLIYFNLIDRNLLYKNIINRVNTHFTIFKLPNVFKNTTYIDIFDLNEKNIFNRQSRCRKTVFISNAFCEDSILTFEEEKKLIKEIDLKFKIDFVLKHPRERYHDKYNKSYVCLNDGRISEEILIDLSKKYVLKVIGVYSTVIINLSTSQNIECVNVRVSNLKKETIGLNRIFDKVGVKSINIGKVEVKD